MKNIVTNPKISFHEGRQSVYLLIISFPFLIVFYVYLYKLYASLWGHFFAIIAFCFTLALSYFLAAIPLLITVPLLLFSRNLIPIRYFLEYKTIENRLSNAYLWSIREALRTEHPDGIVYILEHILQQLHDFGIDFQPRKEQFNFSEKYSQEGINHTRGGNYTVGYPNQANLKSVMMMAQTLSTEWDLINSKERAAAMIEVRRNIKEEDMRLDVDSFCIPRKFRKKNIYYFSYP